MIYGYESRAINEFGLKQMKEISVSAQSDTLRAIAKFLIDAATELETSTPSESWHRHAPPQLAREIGCEVIVLAK